MMNNPQRPARPSSFKKSTPQLAKVAVVSAAILCILLYACAVIYLYGWTPKLILLSVLLLAGLLLSGTGWRKLAERDTRAMLARTDEMVETAIRGNEPMFAYEETALSSLEHKLRRYIGIAKAQERSMELEKNTIKSLISDISHQTKTPLSNVVLYGQLLAETPGLEPEANNLLHQLREESMKLEWLIQTLVKLSRLESGLISLNMADKRLIDTITPVLASIYGQAENKSIKVHVTCDSGITAVHDPKWTSEALLNLLDNAVKYTPEGGSIRLAAESNEMFVRLEVEDNGPGIPEDEIHSIFQRFYRGRNVRDLPGVGIGLYLAREIITIQGGHIQAVSTVGRGSRFSVFLPRREM